MRYTEAEEEEPGARMGLGACLSESYLSGEARVWLGVSIILAPAGLAIGLGLGPGGASWIVAILIAVYLIAGAIGRVRLVPLALLLSIHIGALISSGSAKVILPLSYIEKGPYGSSLAFDPVQLILVYDVASTLWSCRKKESKVKFKAPSPIEENDTAVGGVPR